MLWAVARIFSHLLLPLLFDSVLFVVAAAQSDEASQGRADPVHVAVVVVVIVVVVVGSFDKVCVRLRMALC